MTDKRISELTSITGADTAADDVFVIVDTSSGQTKKITRAELNNAIEIDALADINIDGGTIDNAVIGGSTPVAGSFTTLSATGNITVGGTVDGRDLATDGTKLDGIETGATADQTKSDIDALGIDAATLDGVDSTSFLRSDADDTMTGNLTFADNTAIVFGDDDELSIASNGTNILAELTSPAEFTLYTNGGDAQLNIESGTAGGAGLKLNCTTTGGHQVINAAQADVAFHLQHGGSTKLTIDDDVITTTGDARVTGKVNVGLNSFSASADADDLVIYNNSGNSGISIRGGANSSNNIFFADADVDVGKIQYNHANDSMRFTTNTAEGLRLNSAGDMNLKGDITTGYIPSTFDTGGSYVQAQGGHTYAYTYIRGSSTTYGNTGDNVFHVAAGYLDSKIKFLLNGNGYFDGVADAGSADYAEMFEWDDGNSSNEDRVGYSVALTNDNKIRKATSDDAAADIIGVVSGRPAVVGDTASLGWHGKWETDNFARRRTGDVTFYAWDIEEDGETKRVVHRADCLPSDITIPEDAEEIVTEGELLSSDFDASLEYTPRRERQQWDAVGMLGKLRLRTGQPTGDRWRKLRDIDTDDDGNVIVEEWLVR